MFHVHLQIQLIGGQIGRIDMDIVNQLLNEYDLDIELWLAI